MSSRYWVPDPLAEPWIGADHGECSAPQLALDRRHHLGAHGGGDQRLRQGIGKSAHIRP